MAGKDPVVGDVKSTQERKREQGKDWPKPGEEGFVHPDGTVQAEEQLKANRQAAADRAAAGSVIHGAPSIGGDPEALDKAYARAADPEKAEPGAGYDDPASRNTEAGN